MADDNWTADWKDAEDAQLDAALSATPAQRLAWLEEAILFAYRAGALPRRDEEEQNPGSCEPQSPPRSS
ncbi:MAG TPA: hypothetical protein VHU41_17800 [Thermoanaerobaculia bacterium]|jgi:hypothetical protein|nr:hypothetical protein [Thermoanaerobaculia bacterium]